MVHFKAEYRGNLRTHATHEPSGGTLLTDAPTDNHGKGETFSPTDLVATALGSCMITILGITAQRNGWELGNITWNTKKGMAAAPRKIETVTIAFTLQKMNLSDGQCEKLEHAARNCPVALSLHPEVKQDITFHWVA